jgi:hypothetical protein
VNPDHADLVAAKNQHRNWLFQQQGVQGTAIGQDSTGRPCIKIMTSNASEDTKRQIAARLRGFPVTFEETGEIRAL